MQFSTRNLLLATLLSAGVVVSWYFSRAGREAPPVVDSYAQAPLGYYLRNAVLLGTDDQGSVFYRVLAARVAQADEDDALELEQVRVEYRDSESVNWHVSAEQAQAPSDQTYLELSGNVRLANRADAGATTVIETQKLHLEPDLYLASTDLPVSVSVGGARLDAVGMKAYLKDDRLELESNVHGQFRN